MVWCGCSRRRYCALLILLCVLDPSATISSAEVTLGTSFPKMNFYGNNKHRIGIVMVDDRELEASLTSHTPYNSLTAILNFNYAQRHGYGFHIYNPHLDIDDVMKRYAADSPEKQFNDSNPKLTSEQRRSKMGDSRHRVTAFHPELKQFRGASWSKLLGLYHAAATFSDQYDLIMYLDSDAVITAANGHKTIESMLRRWQQDRNITWGVNDLQSTAMIFFPDTPFGDKVPCAGAFLFRPKISLPLIKSWWDYNISAKNFDVFHEQDALRSILGKQYALSLSTTTMVSEHQFPKDMSVEEWCLRQGWICHICSFWSGNRDRVFRKILGGSVDGYVPYVTQVGYQSTAATLRANHTIAFDVVATAEAMISGQLPPTLSSSPAAMTMTTLNSSSASSELSNSHHHKRFHLRGQKQQQN